VLSIASRGARDRGTAMTALPAAQVERASPAADGRLLPVAWAIVVLLTVPEIILRAFAGVDTWWMTPARIGALSVAIAATWALGTIRPLRGMLVVLLVVYAVEGWLLLTVVPQLPAYRDAVADSPWLAFLGERALRLVAVAVMLAVLLLQGFRRRDVFLAVGDLRATAEPIGVPRSPEPWTRFGRNYGLISVGLLLVFLVPAFSPSLSRLSAGLVVFAAVAAAMNAFAEEFLYRAALIPHVLPLFGKRATLLLVPGWFALAHWFGVPAGMTGVLLAAIGGWFFARSMIETRGIAWAWFLHFLADFTVYLVLLLAGAL
jgi:membrane protease YdiL (CAAX protease family)